MQLQIRQSPVPVSHLAGGGGFTVLDFLSSKTLYAHHFEYDLVLKAQ